MSDKPDTKQGEKLGLVRVFRKCDLIWEIMQIIRTYHLKFQVLLLRSFEVVPLEIERGEIYETIHQTGSRGA